jgi:hypothetical protein
MKIRRVAVVASLAATTLSVPASADHQWGNYRWATLGTGLEVRVNAALTASGGWSPYISGSLGSLNDWNATDAVTVNIPAVSSAVSPKKCSPIAGEILVCDEAYGQRGWLSNTVVRFPTRRDLPILAVPNRPRPTAKSIVREIGLTFWRRGRLIWHPDRASLETAGALSRDNNCCGGATASSAIR